MSVPKSQSISSQSISSSLTHQASALALLTLLCLQSHGVEAHDAYKVTGLLMPESVVAASDGTVYVSEIGEFGKDGDGQITAIDAEGNKRVLVTGMDDPKGLALIGNDLYVADKTRVLKIATQAKPVAWQVFAAESSFPQKPQFLNDLEADIHGNLYVSDSGDLMNGKGGGAIFRIDASGKVSTVINSQQDARIQSPNGLLSDDTGEVLMEVDFATGILYTIQLKTGVMTEIATGFGGGDGIVHHPKGLHYVSDWKSGKVFSVHHDTLTLFKEGLQSAADIGLSADQRYLLVPDMKAGELHYLPIH